MGTPETVDIAAMLQPLGDAAPCGADLAGEGPYMEIKEARREDVMPQGEWQREAKTASFGRVVDVASKALTSQTKDLRLVGFLTEGLVNEYGFAGLRDGARLLREMQEKFWECLYPVVEDGDLEARGKALEWANANLIAPLKSVVLTAGDGREYSWFQWNEGKVTDNLERQDIDRYNAAIASGRLRGAEFEAAFLATPRIFYEGLWEDVDAASREVGALIQFVVDQYKAQVPRLSELQQAMQDCRDLVETLVKRKRELEPDLIEEAVTGGATSTAGGSGGGPLTLEPRDRPDALRRLNAVAAFFRRTEPHSPVAYLVQRAVKWAEMPLESWLQDVIGEDKALATIKHTLGIKE